MGQAQRAPVAKPPAPQPTSSAPSAHAQASRGIAWKTFIANTGAQGAIDACTGGLTRWFEDVDGKPYYPIHRGCGGAPILSLKVGQRVEIGITVYTVSGARDVKKGDVYSAAAGIPGSVLVQTCYADSRMRVVGLTPTGAAKSG
jgi:hypothetical protein